MDIRLRLAPLPLPPEARRLVEDFLEGEVPGLFDLLWEVEGFDELSELLGGTGAWPLFSPRLLGSGRP